MSLFRLRKLLPGMTMRRRISLTGCIWKSPITFDAKELDGFVEWKMMGIRDYVLGLECGNCYPDGRDVMRRTGMLKYLEPGERKQYRVHVAVQS